MKGYSDNRTVVKIITREKKMVQIKGTKCVTARPRRKIRKFDSPVIKATLYRPLPMSRLRPFVPQALTAPGRLRNNVENRNLVAGFVFRPTFISSPAFANATPGICALPNRTKILSFPSWPDGNRGAGPNSRNQSTESSQFSISTSIFTRPK